MKKYGFNIIADDAKKLVSLVRWCRSMIKQHPWYDTINLMIWAYEKGRTDQVGHETGKCKESASSVASGRSVAGKTTSEKGNRTVA